MRHPERHVQHAIHDFPGDISEQRRGCALDGLRLARLPALQHRSRDHGKCRLRHVVIHALDACRRRGSPLCQNLLGRLSHAWHVVQHFGGTEERGHGPPLPAPERPVRAQNAVLQGASENALLDRRLQEDPRLLDQHLLDQIRPHHPDHTAVPDGIEPDDRLLIGRLGQRQQWIPQKAHDKFAQRQDIGRRRHGLRVKRGRVRLCNGHGKALVLCAQLYTVIYVSDRN